MANMTKYTGGALTFCESYKCIHCDVLTLLPARPLFTPCCGKPVETIDHKPAPLTAANILKIPVLALASAHLN